MLQGRLPGGSDFRWGHLLDRPRKVRGLRRLRLDLPVPEDGASYVQVTIQKTPAFDGEVTELAQHPALTEQLAGIRFART